MQPDEEKLFNHVRDWAIGRVQEFNSQDITQIYNQLALIDEFYEWMDPKEDLEVISIDQISEEEFEEFIEGVDRA